jgi:capsule polysaccharide export protein KpsE/RkpR
MTIFNVSVPSLVFHLFEPLTMPGLVHGMAKIKNDLSMFIDFNLLLISQMKNIPPVSQIHQTIAEAVSIEKELLQEFSELSAGTLVLGERSVDFDLLKTKVMFTGDYICQRLNIRKLYSEGGLKDPMAWVEKAYEIERRRYEEHQDVKIIQTPNKKKNEDFSFRIDADF